jgi:hypothetical protein
VPRATCGSRSGLTWEGAAARWLTEIVRGPDATLTLASIGLAVRMADLYEGIDLAEPAPQPRPAGA